MLIERIHNKHTDILKKHIPIWKWTEAEQPGEIVKFTQILNIKILEDELVGPIHHLKLFVKH